jgi:hypothetical protein
MFIMKSNQQSELDSHVLHDMSPGIKESEGPNIFSELRFYPYPICPCQWLVLHMCRGVPRLDEPFRVALASLVEAHTAEVSRLQEELSQLRACGSLADIKPIDSLYTNGGSISSEDKNLSRVVP